MEPRIIRTEEQCRMARTEVERLAVIDPEPESAEGLRLELFSKLVEDYEKSRFAFAKPDPVDAIIFRMEQQGLRQKDIAPLLGGKNRASEVLSRKRRLTKAMISALYQELHIPLELLVREPDAEYRPTNLARAQPGAAGSNTGIDGQKIWLRGFEGFLPLGAARADLMQIPADCGVYAVVRAGDSPPVFLAKSGAGWFKGQDPSYPVRELKEKWVENAPVLYIGKAGPTARRTLRRRILELVRFGSGEPAAHRGGRALWQIEEIWQCRIAWRVAAKDPLGLEQQFLEKFRKRFGKLPFANFRH